MLLPGGALELRNFSRVTPMPGMGRERGNKSSQAWVEDQAFYSGLPDLAAGG